MGHPGEGMRNSMSFNLGDPVNLGKLSRFKSGTWF